MKGKNALDLMVCGESSETKSKYALELNKCGASDKMKSKNALEFLIKTRNAAE
ncbi:hypothetical protein [Paenibacillus harenae]|uniref:hypothetical protein n=1 Tax=Paenibacillus harenae TaxID=306543 RepID=UPI00040807B2|nr:hypothetical protein [Paenibacillus harenae]